MLPFSGRKRVTEGNLNAERRNGKRNNKKD
jgi:hypothetical protein